MKTIATAFFINTLFIFSSCTQHNTVETKQTLYKHICDALFNKHNIKIIDSVFGVNFIYNNSDTHFTGKEAAKKYYLNFFTSFSNSNIDIMEMYAQGDKIICRWSFTGFHTGAYKGIAATGARVEVEGVSIARITGNELTEERVYMNDLGLMQQIGAVPARSGKGF